MRKLLFALLALLIALAGRLQFTVPVGALPLHLRISSVRVSPAGPHISATGRDVHFATDG